MVQLHQEKEFFTNKKIKLVVIVPENKNSLNKFLDKNDIDLNFVPDNKHIIADKYNQAVKILKLGRMPAQIVLDKSLNIVFEHHAKNMADIVSEKDIFGSLKI